jgi:hypothetical protein
VRRDEFEHVIGAAANVVGLDELVVIGSQAILGTYSDPPAALLVSMEPTCTRPSTQTKRSPSTVPSEMVLDSTWSYVRTIVEAKLVDKDQLRSRIPLLPVAASDQEHIERMLESILRDWGRSPAR